MPRKAFKVALSHKPATERIGALGKAHAEGSADRRL